MAADRPGFAIVWATRARGAGLRHVAERAQRLASAAGGTSIIVATEAEDGDRVEGVRLLRAPAATLSAALVIGARQAGADRCLFLDDEVEIREEGAAAQRHAHPFSISVGPLRGLPPRASPDRSSDPHVMMALARGRNCTFPPDALDRINAAALEDPIACFRLGRELAGAGIPVTQNQEASARWRGARTAAHALGAAAARLYHEEPVTLASSGIATYARARWCERALWGPLLRMPRALLTTAAALTERRGHPTPAPIADALWWHGVRKAAGRSRWRRLAGGVTILMFHGFTSDGTASRYVMPTRRLKRRLWLLRVLRRRVLPLDEYVRLRQQYALPPPRSTIITIDDGYDDTYSLAAPLLHRFGMPATVFVVTARVGRTNDWDTDGPLRARTLADWPQLRAGLGDGLALGAHTRTHPHLPSLEPNALADEVAGSRDDLSDALGHAATVFAYPYGELDERATRAVSAAGFAAACSCRPGVNDHCEPVAVLRRVEAWGTDPLWRFAAAAIFGRRSL